MEYAAEGINGQCVRQCARVTYIVGALCISVTVSVCGCVR